MIGSKGNQAKGKEVMARRFSLFMNWLNGICAPICGLWMMLSALFDLPLSWNDWMPLSIYDSFPFHDVFFTSHFWPGLALLLVNGVPNVIAIIFKYRDDVRAWVYWCVVAGVLLIIWTVIELILIPNGISVFYFVLDVLQLFFALRLLRGLDEPFPRGG